MDIDYLEDLEGQVLDQLEAADEAGVPEGTLSLWAARRRRGLDEVARLLGSG
jgi:hypothetical protein